MNNLILEILLTFLILSILITFIPLIHSTVSLMTDMAGVTFSSSLPEEEKLPPYTLEGIDVASVIEYYSSYPEVSIHLSSGQGEKIYTDTSMNTDPFPYNFSFTDLYHTEIIDEDGSITEIYFYEIKE